MSLFSDLANLGDALATTKKKLEHRALIGTYLKTLPPDEIAIAARWLIGRVFPESDPRILNLSGSAIDRVLEQITGAINWDAIAGAVDFGDAVEKWLTPRQHARQGKPLQLLQVYRTYEAIAKDTGPGSRERKDERLRELLARAAPREAKYIVKHLVKEMRVGVSEGTLLDAIADASGVPDATIRRANQVSGDVGEVARVVLSEGARGLGRMAMHVGVPLKPMLTQSAADVSDAFAKMEGAFALECKFDGARVQIHKRGNSVQLFSRQLSDITVSLPEIADAARREIRARDAVLEGEVIALTDEGKPRPFQDVIRRFGRARDRTDAARHSAETLPLRRAPRRWHKFARHAELGAMGQTAGGTRRARMCRTDRAARCRGGGSVSAPCARRGARRADGEKCRVAVRAGRTRQTLAQDQACDYTRPRHRRGELGLRSAHRLAVERASRRA